MRLPFTVVVMLTMSCTAGAVLAQESAVGSGWQQYSYPGSRFAAQFPVQPRRDAGAAGVETYVANKEGVEYRVTVTEGATADAIQRAESRLTAGASVHAAVDARIDRQFGREFSYSTPAGARSVAAVFIVEGRMIELVGTAPPALALARSGDLLRFQQSLTFIDAQGNEPRRGPPGGGGGGPGGRGGPGGPDGRRGPTAGAMAACEGHKVGDAVTLQTPEGAVPARCVLVARPDRPPPR